MRGFPCTGRNKTRRKKIIDKFYFRLELQRIKFMVNSYLRIRLQKIQNNIFYYTNQHQDNPDRLTNKVDQLVSHNSNIKILLCFNQVIQSLYL